MMLDKRGENSANKRRSGLVPKKVGIFANLFKSRNCGFHRWSFTSYQMFVCSVGRVIRTD